MSSLLSMSLIFLKKHMHHANYIQNCTKLYIDETKKDSHVL